MKKSSFAAYVLFLTFLLASCNNGTNKNNDSTQKLDETTRLEIETFAKEMAQGMAKCHTFSNDSIKSLCLESLTQQAELFDKQHPTESEQKEFRIQYTKELRSVLPSEETEVLSSIINE